MGERKTWAVIQNLVLQVRACVTGTVYYPETHEFRKVTEEELTPPEDPAGAGTLWVMSGSTFTAELPLRAERGWLRKGIIAPLGACLHTDLEKFFGPELSQNLRANDIWTLEDVAHEKIARLAPYGMVGQSKRVPLRRLLAVYAAPEIVGDWIQEVRNFLAAEASAQPAPAMESLKESEP